MATKPTTPKTPRKPAAAKAAPNLTKPTLVQDGPAPVVAEAEAATTEATNANGMRLRDLVDRVTAVSGAKKKDVKTILEAALIHMGDALQKGESLNLAGLGKVRVARKGPEGSGVLTLKLKLGGGGEGKEKPDTDPLADDEDQD